MKELARHYHEQLKVKLNNLRDRESRASADSYHRSEDEHYDEFPFGRDVYTDSLAKVVYEANLEVSGNGLEKVDKS